MTTGVFHVELGWVKESHCEAAVSYFVIARPRSGRGKLFPPSLRGCRKAAVAIS